MTKKNQDAVARRGYAKVVDYQTVFNSPIGKKVLHDMMAAHSVLQPTYVSGDVNQTLLHEGERRVVLRILAFLKTDPKNLLERIEDHEKQME